LDVVIEKKVTQYKEKWGRKFKNNLAQDKLKKRTSKSQWNSIAESAYKTEQEIV